MGRHQRTHSQHRLPLVHTLTGTRRECFDCTGVWRFLRSTYATLWPPCRCFSISGASSDSTQRCSIATGDGARAFASWRVAPRGRASIAVTENDSGRWDVDVRIRVRGRRLTRPLFAVASLFLGRYTRRRFDKAVDQLPEKVESFNRDVRTRFGGMPSPQSIANDALDGLLADVAEHLPQV